MSYHGTHVVVIEIPEGSWGAGIRLYRLWTRGVGATDLRLTNRLPTESRKGEAILYS